MAKNQNKAQSKGNRKTNKNQSKAKTARRVLNAYEIATRAESHRNGGDSGSESDDGAIVNPMKKDNEDAEFEDEELDSDEALGSDDDFDVMSSKFSQSIRDKAKKLKSKGKNKGRRDEESEESEDDEEEDYDSVDEGEFVSLTEVWDLDDADMKTTGGKDGDVVLADSEESESESDDESDEEDSEDSEGEEEEEAFPFSDEDSQDEDASDVELTTLKSKLSKKSKDKLHYQTLNIPENELALAGGGDDISLADMLSVVDASASKKAILISTDETDEKAGKPLAIPLPQRIQDRNERRAAYEITKGEVNKWEEVVQANRNKEVLTFDQQVSKHKTVSAFSSESHGKPFNDLEAKINGLLQDSSLLDEKKESTFEEIATAKMSKEELAKRQGELRKMRELMFRQEREAKRIKKIKSKSYRKVKKREMLRNKALIEGEEDSDPEDHDMRRAQERMSLKHKNNSDWAKRMIHSGLSKDSEAREEMEEMLRRGERLRSKVLDRDDDDDEFGDMRDMNIDREMEEANEEERSKLGKTGVMNMAFMKSAEAKEKIQNEEIRARLRKLEADGDLADFENDETDAVDKHINAGRRVYSAGAKTASAEMAEVNKEVREEVEIDQSTGLKAKLNGGKSKSKPTSETTEQKTQEQQPAEESNPWLTPNDTPVQKSSKLRVVDQNSSKLSKNQAKLLKNQAKSTTKSNKRKASELSDDESEVIDMNQTLKIVDKHSTSDNEGEEVNDQDIMLFKQSDLLKQAFAGDDVVREFEMEKKQQIKDEGDQVEDLTLPGWGDWAGSSGSKKNKKNKNKKVKVTKGVAFNSREDKFKDKVIINEKVQKKNAKYQSSSIPFPFESREQYERSLRMPIGQEWTSRETHQRLTMPKLVVKSGVVVNPLKAPFK
ncbi:hypothetical protein WICPIJ_010147 [Wickerhamomyces pijperi]|uniref:U3 small nucleolar RNA-associated protein 14 n=1 Tax=Wickerhamomyces pijperi TaxID=599730 RepID=A0A9P8PGX7_WICPI|nr:hypothetical protein WICPIJ_010147 [Wickerhamomyces pijperi]